MVSADLTSRLSSYVAGLTADDIPAPVIAHARLMLADTIGVALAGTGENSARIVMKALGRETGPCAVWGTRDTASPSAAAQINGALAHALDYDDNNMSMIGHSSAPVVPALLALADTADVSLLDIIVAYVAGVQVESVLGRIATLEHNARGWHTTSTLGSFGAAAACARLKALAAGPTADALAITASFASGLKHNFGTTTKPLHAGMAARNGLLAADLAAAGMAANPLAVEGDQGFLSLYAGIPPKDQKLLEGALSGFEILQSFPKIYPTCSMVHQLLDLAIDGLASQRIQAGQIENVTCSVSYHAASIMNYPQPRNPTECRFSIEYCVAVALCHGTVANKYFDEAVIHDPAVREMMTRIKLVIPPEQSDKERFEAAYLKGEAKSWLEVEQRDGSVFKEGEALQKGHPDNPVGAAEIREKFMACATVALSANAAEALWRRLVEDDPAVRFKPAEALRN
ncbi:MmgE/PrpD family protein [Chelatococcus sp. GCM10030263]|uniref:MmgE/PrpD family protein n=1 Tax=Chelatococcus sp. GCM10030263 TaxID=3273387 RepID=UPI00360E1E3C